MRMISKCHIDIVATPHISNIDIVATPHIPTSCIWHQQCQPNMAPKFRVPYFYWYCWCHTTARHPSHTYVPHVLTLLLVLYSPHPLLLSEVHQKWLGLTSFVCLEEDTRHWYVIVYNVLQYYHLNAGREGLLRIGHSFWAEWEFQVLIAKLLKSVENRPTESAKCKL